MNQYQVDFQQLRIKHILFKSKVRSVLYGGKQDTDFFSASGPVSIWFSTIGMPNYGTQPEMRELYAKQQELNSLALQLFRLYNSGQIEQAHEGLKEIELRSDQFVNTLIVLEKRLTSGEANLQRTGSL